MPVLRCSIHGGNRRLSSRLSLLGVRGSRAQLGLGPNV